MLNNNPKTVDQFRIVGKTEDSFIDSYVVREQFRGGDSDFFVILEILNKEVNGEEIAESLIETFRKYFYEESDLDDYSRFEEALKHMNVVASDLRENDGMILHQVNMIVAGLCGNNLFVAQSNDAEIYLIREGNLSNISEGLSKGKRNENTELFENIATGVLRKDDIVLLTTTRLIRYLTGADIAKIFVNSNLDKNLKEIDSRISLDILGRIGVLALFVAEPLSLEEMDSLEEVVKEKIDWKGISWKERWLLLIGKFKYGIKKIKPFFKELKLFFVSVLTGKKVDWRKLKYGKVILGMFIVLIIWLILLPTGVLDSATKKAELVLIEDAQDLISSAKSELNKEKALELVRTAEEKLKNVENKSLSNKVRNLEIELSDVIAKNDNLVRLEGLKIFADISSKRSTVKLLGMQKYLNNYYAYDSSRLYEFIGDLVKDPVNISDENNIKVGIVFEDEEALLFSTFDNKIKEFAKNTVRTIKTDEGQFKPMKSIFAYGSRIYGLDTNEGQIWRYQMRQSDFGRAEPALTNIDNDRLKNAVGIAIDGGIYVLYRDGGVQRYYAGSLSTDFGLGNSMLTTIENANFIYTEADFPYIFVLESDSKKLFQFFKNQKTGKMDYMRQYYFADLDTVTGFIVDLAGKKILVSDDTKIYVTELLN